MFFLSIKIFNVQNQESKSSLPSTFSAPIRFLPLRYLEVPLDVPVGLAEGFAAGLALDVASLP